jgi:hypothetical protein
MHYSCSNLQRRNLLPNERRGNAMEREKCTSIEKRGREPFDISYIITLRVCFCWNVLERAPSSLELYHEFVTFIMPLNLPQQVFEPSFAALFVSPALEGAHALAALSNLESNLI